MNYQEINKQNIERWEDALRYLINILNKNDIKYYLSASGFEYVLGGDRYPYDIDLFTSTEDVRKAFELLKKYAVSDLHKFENLYLEFQGKINDVPFEICEWEEDIEVKEITYKDFRIKISI